MYKYALVTTGLLSIFSVTEGSYNILAVFLTPSFSHQQSCLGLTRALAEKGHNLTVLTANPGLNEPLPNHHEIDLSMLYQVWADYQIKNNYSLQTTLSVFDALPPFAEIFGIFSESAFKNSDVQNLIRSKSTKFDLIIYEGLYPSALGLVHHFNYPPSIVFFTIARYIPLQYSMGNPINPSYISSFATSYSDKMTFFERIVNTFFVFYEIYVHKYYMYPIHDRVIKNIFGENIPSTEDLEKNNSLLILNGDLSQDYPLPFQPNTIQIGTLHINKNLQPLPIDVQKWIDESEDGVIYFSLGSNMKGTSLPEEKRNIFTKVFSQFSKFRVIWKWEGKDFPGKPKNVLLKKWLPQQSVLAHPKIKLFISQGGQQSRQEAIHFGVPVLTVPMFWDQGWNGMKLEDFGAGLNLNFHEITFESLLEKIQILLTNPSYKSNMKKLSMISKDKLMTNSDTAVWWTEYIIRHNGANHLRPNFQNLAWYQSSLLDIISFIISVLFIIFYLLYYFIKKLFCSFSNKNNASSRRKKTKTN